MIVFFVIDDVQLSDDELEGFFNQFIIEQVASDDY